MRRAIMSERDADDFRLGMFRYPNHRIDFARHQTFSGCKNFNGRPVRFLFVTIKLIARLFCSDYAAHL